MPNSPIIRVYWHRPEIVLQAQINMPGTISYPVQNLTYDTVTTGAYTDCETDMLFTLGSAAGGDDLGRGRLRATPTSSLLKIGRSSQGFEDGQLSVVNDAYITVWDDFRVWGKIPVISKSPDFIELKDGDIAVGDNTIYPPPIANTGPAFARRIDADTGLITVALDGSNSFAVADGATIASYTWNIKDGSFAFGSVDTDASIIATFPAGFRWVSLTVVDDNGKSHIARVPILAHDPDDSLCVPGMQVLSITRNQQGTAARLRTLVDLPRADYADGGLVLIFEDHDPAIYGTPDPADHDNLLFTGWHQADQASSRVLTTHLQRETALTCVDVLGRLDSLPGFPQRVEVPDEEEGLTWGEMPAATMDKFLCYLIHWHSTAASVADFTPSGTWDEYPFVIFDAVGDTLYNQLQRQANRLVPDHNFTSDQFGAMRVVPNPQFQNPDDRTSVALTLSEETWSEIDYGYERPPRVHTTRASALLVQSEWIIDEDDKKQLLPPVFSIAPGYAPGQGGREATLGERLAKSQEDLNDCTGHHHAHSNARYGPITLTLNTNANPWTIDPAAHTWVLLAMTDEVAPQRGFDGESTRTLPTEVTIDYSYSEEGTTWRARARLERETVGEPALTEETEEALPVGEQPIPTLVPDFGLREGQELVAGIGADGYIYVTSDFQTDSGSGGPTWTRTDTTIADTIYSFVVDPFSPGYAPGATSGAINGWIANDTGIYRVTDLFGSVAATSVYTFDEATSGASYHWRTIQASFGAYFAEGANPWLLCVSYYGATSGHTGTWCTYSTDGGATWADEVEVSEFYDTGASEFKPVAVYTSPRTPGLAYTTAFTETGLSPLADGYVSDDWGATWTRVSSVPVDDPTEPLPQWVNWPDSGSLTLLGLGARASASILAEELVPVGGTAEDGTNLFPCPPADTKRIEVHGEWTATRSSGGSTASSFATTHAGTVTQTGNDDYSTPSAGTSASGSFDVTWEFAGGDWPVNRTSVVSSPPGSPSSAGGRCDLFASANSSGTPASMSISLTLTITEIELDGGAIYTPPLYGFGAIQPGNGRGGTIHLPWQDNSDELLAYFGYFENIANREFRLKQSVGGVITDISPVDDDISFGPSRGPFGIRAYDSDRQYLALAGRGNDTSGDAADDLVGLWISSGAGASWTNILAPVDAANTLNGLEIAFGGDDPDVLFAWGAYSDSSLAAIYYSADGGSTLDSRQGNMDSLGTTALIGIAGGPAS